MFDGRDVVVNGRPAGRGHSMLSTDIVPKEDVQLDLMYRNKFLPFMARLSDDDKYVQYTVGVGIDERVGGREFIGFDNGLCTGADAMGK